MKKNSRGDRYLSHSSRHTQVPVPATIMAVRKIIVEGAFQLTGVFRDFPIFF